MTRLIQILIVITCLSQQVFAQPKKTLQDADIIIRHVNVLNMKDSVPQNDQCICIQGDKISYIGKDILPEQLQLKAKIVPAHNQYLMPGMAEMHIHLPPAEEMKNFMTMNLMAGVTTVRSMRGDPEHLTYRKPQGYPMPDLVLASPIVTNKTIINEHTADSIVKKYKADGYDCIKVIAIADSLSFVTLMKYAHKYKMPVAGHMLNNVGLACMLNNGYNTIEHLSGYTEAADTNEQYYHAMVALTKKSNTCLCPTLDWYRVMFKDIPTEALRKRYGLNLLPDSVINLWDEQLVSIDSQMTVPPLKDMAAKYPKTHKLKMRILKEMSDEGIRMVLGSESGDTYMVPGFNIAEEMKAFQQAGISNYKILQYATITAAQYLGRDKEEGTVEKGKKANLVLLGANPLEDLDAISTVQGVWLHGHHYTEKELQASLN